MLPSRARPQGPGARYTCALREQHERGRERLASHLQAHVVHARALPSAAERRTIHGRTEAPHYRRSVRDLLQAPTSNVEQAQIEALSGVAQRDGVVDDGATLAWIVRRDPQGKLARSPRGGAADATVRARGPGDMD